VIIALSCPDDHLVYYRFAGRTLGRALVDRQLIKGHLVRMIYKHLLGWPITIEDIKAQDEEYYHSLKKLLDLEDVSAMCLDFTATEENMGMRIERELVDGGNMKEVSNENLQEYLEANIRYRIFSRISSQLTELLLGFFDVVPEPALTVFDANELELMLCGLPEINLEDWKSNTRYKGAFEFVGENHVVVKWFWEVVEHDFDQEMRARLLQFATGTSGVPARGFSCLQGIDGNIKKFTIQGIDYDVSMFPKSHTCFNRIDLPVYHSKEALKEKLTIAITTSFVGFDVE
jgi:HECT-domain (ubiquitin-transferase)